MPPVITAIVEVTFWVAKAYSTAIALGGAGAFAVRLGTVALLSSLSSKLFGPKVQGVGLSPMDVMSRSSLEHRKIVYGQAIVSGPVYYNNLSGTNNEYLWYGVALCDGLSEDLVEVHFDSDVITKAQIDWVAGTTSSDGTGTGDVSTSTFVGDNSTAGAQIYYYLGDDAQPVCGVLDTAFGAITTNHRLRGVTHIVCKLLYDEDTEEVWKSGPPNDIKVVLKGRLVYDPRLDTTQAINKTTSPYTYGSGAHRTTDATTWAWSDNPSLCIADYLTQVMGVATTAIDWPSVANAADDCEVLVVTTPAASPENTEARFTCNGALSLGSSHKDNLDSILSSMAGKLSYSGGVWKVRASVWETSSVTITEDDLAGDLDVRGSAPRSERFNGVRGFFVDPTRNYEASEFPHVSEATYVTRDNGETITYDLQLPMTNSATEAQRIAYRNLAQGNNQIVAKLKLNAKGSKIAVGDVVTHTISTFWSSKTFRCIEWARNPDSTFDVTLKEDDSTDYTDPLVTAYGTAGTGGVTIPADIVKPPTGLTATAGVGGIRLDWTNPPAASYDYIDIYEDTNDSWTGSGLIASVRANTFFVSRAAGTTYYYWIRAVRKPDLESLREPNSDTTTISAAATGGSDGDSVFYATVYIRNSGTPSTPSVDDGSFNFTSQELNPPAGWSATIPSVGSPTLPVYSSHGVFSISGTSGTDSTVTWSAPGLVAQDGIDGIDGAAGGTGAAGIDSVAVSYTNNSHAVPVDNGGTETWTGSGGLFYAYEGATTLTLDTNTQGTGYPVTPGEYRLNITNVSGDTLTEPAITGQTTTTATIADWAGNLTTATVYRITAYILTSNSTQISISSDVTLSPSDQGADGGTGSAGTDGDDAIAMNYTNNSHAVPVTNTGTETWTGSGGKCYIFEGPTLLTLNTNTQTGSYAGLSNSEYNLNITKVSGDTLTEPGITGQTTTTATIADWASNLTQATVYQLDAYVQDSNANQVTITEYITLSPADQGADGAAGTSPVVSQLTNSAVVVSADYDGTNYSLTGAGGTHQVLEGDTDVTTSSTHIVVGETGSPLGVTQNGLTMSVGGATGVYTLTGAGDSWTSDEESFTMRATYGGNNYDKVYTIAKSKQAQVVRINAVGKNLNAEDISTDDTATGFKVDNDGYIYSYAENGAGPLSKTYVQGSQWLGSGVVGDYEVILDKISSTPSDPAGSNLDEWLGCGTDRAWTYEVTTVGTKTFAGTLRWRDATTLEVLGQATLDMNCNVEV